MAGGPGAQPGPETFGHSDFPGKAHGRRLEGTGGQSLQSAGLDGFWTNLKQGYDLFEKSHRLATIKTREDGTYEFIGEITSRRKH